MECIFQKVQRLLVTLGALCCALNSVTFIHVFHLRFMCRDPRIWEDPNEFKPERWLPASNPNLDALPDIYDIAFGFGRRYEWSRL